MAMAALGAFGGIQITEHNLSLSADGELGIKVFCLLMLFVETKNFVRKSEERINFPF